MQEVGEDGAVQLNNRMNLRLLEINISSRTSKIIEHDNDVWSGISRKCQLPTSINKRTLRVLLQLQRQQL